MGYSIQSSRHRSCGWASFLVGIIEHCLRVQIKGLRLSEYIPGLSAHSFRTESIKDCSPSLNNDRTRTEGRLKEAVPHFSSILKELRFRCRPKYDRKY